MKVKLKLVVTIILVLTFACSEKQEMLILDKNYLTVADLLEYCQGPCDETQTWENQTVLVKGHVRDIESDSVMNEYAKNSRFYLQDIRNGMYMEIRVEDNKEAIFNILEAGNKQDLFFIKGVTAPVIANNEGDCQKGVVVLLYQPGDIYFENQ